MKVIERPEQAYAHIDHWRQSGQRVGLVPTMGALHAGHLSLVQRSLDECDRTVVSIFVNPTQFGPNEDFTRYPRTMDNDLAALRQLKVDVVFTPASEVLYPPGFSTYVEPPEASRVLEGVFRPGHFRGVATVVLKLFQIIPAHIAYFGQKDYQQLAVIRRTVDDLNVPIRVVGCPTMREADGLAMSSRNRYLSTEQRPAALGLSAALKITEQLFAEGERNVQTLEGAMVKVLEARAVDRIDYARVVDAESLADIQTVETPAVALIAAFVGQTRLIDNTVLM